MPVRYLLLKPLRTFADKSFEGPSPDRLSVHVSTPGFNAQSIVPEYQLQVWYANFKPFI